METKRLFELNSFNINDYETEQVFRETCSWYESKFPISDKLPSQAYKKYINSYHKAKSLYLIAKGIKKKTQLIVYDTENEIENIKILKTSISFGWYANLTPLPNGELFCSCAYQDKAFIIDINCEVRRLPSGLPWFSKSAIYFNSNVYCFGGEDKNENRLNFSRKFNLNENRWINLMPMPKTDCYCSSLIFNENILICGYYSKKLFLYSVDIDSFSKIPYKFSYERKKLLINAERLYLIECSGFIYESEFENEYIWNKISYSVIRDKIPDQVYCLYNKGEIYISVWSFVEKLRFKFDLKKKNFK